MVKNTAQAKQLPKKASYKYLVIVESPAKSKTIEKYLGKEYKVLASMGHLRDLPKSRLAIDIANNFEPYYCIVKGKNKYVKELREYAKLAEKVYLATDPDREGESIAWHLVTALDLPPDKYERIEFNEITKDAVIDSLKHARKIDENRVNAQQARRCLDRLVGYMISPLLWKRVKRGLSAGRVQSAALNLICKREEEIAAFQPVEYWNIDVELIAKNGSFKAQVFNTNPPQENFNIPDGPSADQIEASLRQSQFKVISVQRKERRRNPYAPFITSTLQQEASRRLGFNARKTMLVAQQLYEGVELGPEGSVGLITYMRTDSTRVADVALAELRDFIKREFGSEYGVEVPNVYKQKKSAQDAHEAIRPTSVLREPKHVEKYLTSDQFKLYKLIWRRFVASQMAPAIYDQTTIEISSGQYLLKATGSVVKFPGFLKVYEEKTDEEEKTTEETVILPEVAEGEILKLNAINKKQCFTQPPPRYTEASLVKTLEELGIGRPSTYAPIISTIQMRNYVTKQGKALVPTELGKIVDKQIKKHFREIVDVGFTAEMELKLDEIEEGQQEWRQMLNEFYVPFSKEVELAEQNMEDMRVPDRPTNEICEKCGKPMVIKSGRFGDFMACSGFPECRNTKTILKVLEDVFCPKCGNPIVERKTKRGRLFYGCTAYPTCDFATWEKPLKENCPKCGSFLVERKDKTSGKKVKLCVKCDEQKIEENVENIEKEDETAA